MGVVLLVHKGPTAVCSCPDNREPGSTHAQALVKMVMELSDADIQSLPPEQREQILMLVCAVYAV